MKLKKIMAIILCAVLVTVGGVFATWQYATGTVSEQTISFGTPIMADVSISEAIGTLQVDSSALSMKIDDTNNDKIAELIITGELKLIFIPHEDAAPEIRENGIALKYTISGRGDPQYNGSSVFSFTEITETTEKGLTAVISAETIMRAIKINEISLPTYDDYQEFEKNLPTTLLSIKVEAAE